MLQVGDTAQITDNNVRSFYPGARVVLVEYSQIFDEYRVKAEHGQVEAWASPGSLRLIAKNMENARRTES